MSIIVKIGETQISDNIIFTNMTPWFAQPKTVTHQIDGADYDAVIHTGKRSRTTTLKGYCKRTLTNLTELDTLDDGSIITIIHSVEGTRNGIVTGMSVTSTAGGLFVSFSMTVVEQ